MDKLTESMTRSAKRALASTSMGQLKKLTEARAFWQRRKTIASNKLAETQREIDKLSLAMADKLLDHELP